MISIIMGMATESNTAGGKMRLIVVAFLTVFFCSGVYAETDAKLGEEEFKAGLQLMEKKEWAEALPHLKKALDGKPTSTNTLWHLGVASFELGMHKEALEYWLKAHELGGIMAKIIQAYEALGLPDKRDAMRSELFLLRQDKAEKAMMNTGAYCRDQFTAGRWRVFAIEYFEPDPEITILYRFSFTEGSAREKFAIVFGTFASDTAIARERGEIKPNVTVYHWDRYYPGGLKALLGFYDAEIPPAYEIVKAKVIEYAK